MATAPKTQRLEETRPESDQRASHPFSDPTPDSDLILLVEGQRLHVNKIVLSLASPVFKRMFEANFKEKSSKEITLSGKKFADMLEFLLCLYPSTCKTISRENLEAVLPLALEYEVQQLVDRCEEFSLNFLELFDGKPRNPPLKELVHFLFLADKYDLKKLLEACTEKMVARSYVSRKNKQAAEDMEEFQMVSCKIKYEILLKRMRLMEPLARMIPGGYEVKSATQALKKRCFAFD